MGSSDKGLIGVSYIHEMAGSIPPLPTTSFQEFIVTFAEKFEKQCAFRLANPDKDMPLELRLSAKEKAWLLDCWNEALEKTAFEEGE